MPFDAVGLVLQWPLPAYSCGAEPSQLFQAAWAAFPLGHRETLAAALHSASCWDVALDLEDLKKIRAEPVDAYAIYEDVRLQHTFSESLLRVMAATRLAAATESWMRALFGCLPWLARICFWRASSADTARAAREVFEQFFVLEIFPPSWRAELLYLMETPNLPGVPAWMNTGGCHADAPAKDLLLMTQPPQQPAPLPSLWFDDLDALPVGLLISAATRHGATLPLDPKILPCSAVCEKSAETAATADTFKAELEQQLKLLAPELGVTLEALMAELPGLQQNRKRFRPVASRTAAVTNDGSFTKSSGSSRGGLGSYASEMSDIETFRKMQQQQRHMN